MPVLGAIAIALAGIHAYVALYYAALYLLRRQLEYRAFAGMCGGLAVFAVASAFPLEASSPARAVVAQELRFAVMMPTTLFFVDLALRLSELERPRLLRATSAVAVAGVMAAAAWLTFDPALPNPGYDWSVASAGRSPLAHLTIPGAAVELAILAVASYTVGSLFRRARGRRDLRLAAFGVGLAIAAGLVQLIAELFGLELPDLRVIASVLPVAGFGIVLMDRFARVDSQLAARTEELERSTDHLRAAQQELVRKEQLAAVGELSAIVAHEVRNPLAIIKNAVSGLSREELPANDEATLLAILDEESDRLNHLVRDLLAYAKPFTPEPGAEVDMCTLVMHAVELAAGGHRDLSHIELELELDGPAKHVEGDETLLRHALINIVDNALQAMPLGGTLTVTCRDAEVDGRQSVAIDFHDTGEGMDTVVRSKARDPFFTTRQTGAGLGLAIVERVARAHGGRVEIDSHDGQGTRVTFLVPRRRLGALAPAF